MLLYEHVFIARQDISPQRAQTLIEEFSALIAQQGGNVSKTEYWGLLNLAYRIKKNRKGHYMLLNIEASHEAVQEMERQMKLHDDILRFLTVRVDQHDRDPSPPMRRATKEKEWLENESPESNELVDIDAPATEIGAARETKSPHNETQDETS